MSVLPVSVSRTSDMLSQQRLMQQLNSDQVALQRLYDQLSTGRRLTVPSDDPGAASRAIGLQRGIDYSEQLVRNARAGEQSLEAVDASMAQMSDAAIEARSLAVQAAQGTITDSERMAVVESLDQLVQRVVSSANRQHQGRYVFAGGRNETPPLSTHEGYVRFDGNGFVSSSVLEPSAMTQTGFTAESVLGVGTPTVAGEVDLEPRLTRDTPLAAIADGRGWTPGRLRLAGADSGWVEVDLSQVETLGQLEDRLEGVSLGGRELEVTLGADSLQLAYRDGLPGVLAAGDPPGGSVAADLGWSNPSGADPPPLEGDGLAPALRPDTPLADLAGGAGVDVSDGLRIRQGDAWYTVDLSQAETIGEVVTEINRSGADVRATIDPTGHRVVVRSLRSGVDFGIGENGGLAATALGLRTSTAETGLDQLNRGHGAATVGGADLTVVRPDGVELAIDLDGLSTIGDVLEAINAHPDNTGTTERVEAALTDLGNGIQLTGPDGPGPLVVRSVAGSNAGEALGLVEPGQGERIAPSGEIVGTDYAPVETGGIVDTLMRLRDAAEQGDAGELERMQDRLDDEFDVLQTTRGRAGMRLQDATAARERIEDDQVRMRAGLSEEIEVDFAEVVSNMTLRQASLEASMRLVGQTAQMSILNYL